MEHSSTVIATFAWALQITSRSRLMSQVNFCISTEKVVFPEVICRFGFEFLLRWEQI